MPVALQSVLLRLLDDWLVRPVGGGRPRQVNVLLMAATNAKMEQAVADGRFRSDLFCRLDATGVALPPLRDRMDIASIANRLLAQAAPGGNLSETARRLGVSRNTAYRAIKPHGP